MILINPHVKINHFFNQNRITHSIEIPGSKFQEAKASYPFCDFWLVVWNLGLQKCNKFAYHSWFYHEFNGNRLCIEKWKTEIFKYPLKSYLPRFAVEREVA